MELHALLPVRLELRRIVNTATPTLDLIVGCHAARANRHPVRRLMPVLLRIQAETPRRVHGSAQAPLLGFRHRARQLQESSQASPYLPASFVNIDGPVGRKCWR